MANHAAVIPSPKVQLKVITRAIPTTPGPHQIVIRNRAIATNPLDWKIQERDVFIKTYPAILGTDVAGTAEEIGTSVTRFHKGDRVSGYAIIFFQDNSILDGVAFQEYVLVDAGCCIKLPESVTFEEGSLLPMAVATTGLAIFENLAVPTNGGRRHHACVKTLGAKYLFDYRSERVVAEIVDAAKKAGVGIALAYDAISERGTVQSCLDVLDMFGGGKLCMVLAKPEGLEAPANVDVSRIFALRVLNGWKEGGTWLFNDWLEKALLDGSYKPSPGIQIVEGGLGGVQTALNLHKKGVSGKKLVIPLE